MPIFRRPPTLAPLGEEGARAGGAAPVWGAVLDAAALARLAELDPKGKAGLVARVVTTYTQSLGKLLEQLTVARTAGDANALRHVAHTLKSSSASVGALQLSGLCADIERKVRDRQTDGLDAQLEEMLREGARVLAALRAGTAGPQRLS
jgi:HPt (histidine-containing phosphotransfer) domain-containing protein